MVRDRLNNNTVVRVGTMASIVPFSSFVKMSSGLVNLLGSRSTLLSGRTPPLYCKAVLRGNIMQKLVARFNGVSASGGDLVLKQLEKKLFKRDAFLRFVGDFCTIREQFFI